MAVSHEGGIFTTRTLDRGSPEEHELVRENVGVLRTLGLVRGVTHTEFIRGAEDGKFYFLETAARVGGANIVELVEAATGVNLWHEWAKIEVAGEGGGYQPPERRYDFAGVVISLARQEWPDTGHFTDGEITYRLHRKHHVGFVVASPKLERVQELLDQYAVRIQEEFHAALPPTDRPTA
jgi:biotin carboxylase